MSSFRLENFNRRIQGVALIEPFGRICVFGKQTKNWFP
jgi:hypothetical protein